MSKLPRALNLHLNHQQNVIPLINIHRQPKQIIPFPSQTNQLIPKTSNKHTKLQTSLHSSWMPSSSYLKFQKSLPLKNSPELTPEDKQELQRKINLSNLIKNLKTQLPNILENNLSKDIISSKIYLRICPSQFDENYLPKLQGYLTYYSTCKAIQLFITSIILSPKVKLHLTNIKIADKNQPDSNCMFPNSTKLYIRWNTCIPNCIEHLGLNQSTTQANFGSHKWSNEDTKNLFSNNHNLSNSKNQEDSSINLNLSKFIGKITRTLLSGSKLTNNHSQENQSDKEDSSKSNKELERVIYGLFIFELNEDCNQILVHTIENMDIVERFEPEEESSQVNGLRVC
ncbi:uncharacterized protein KGF55_002779 [Candida pseudojiufengensis]|uniref:uncharacterized protein n=1 Tax=Candida pseudojiufengensis TaxID=497109 RepID=UPI0022253E14|nr:uncharacterized protein KGF55_002779 [Candida pseudojiufengensis]KAI5962987.1 hypothetical protein KGF55_002779 [Candida pseudojiufengensis]